MPKIILDLSNLTKHINNSFLPLFKDLNRYIILRGGAGSGKSVSIAQIVIYKILVTYNYTEPHIILCLRKTSPAARKSLFPLLQNTISAFGLRELVTNINKTEMSITFSNGSTIVCMGLDDPDKIKSVFGITSIWLEEATEFTRDDIYQLDLRMRGKSQHYYTMYLSFNPVSKLHPIHDMFFVNPSKDTTLHHSTYLDNRFLDDVYKARLESLIHQDRSYYNIYTLGEWGSLENLIYTKYSFLKSFPEDTKDVVYGLDWGYNHPTALVKVGEIDGGFVVQQQYYERLKTVGDLIEYLPQIIPSKNSPIYADSARPDAIEEVFRSGYNIHPADKKPGSVKDGIDFIKQNNLYITEDSTDLIKELNTYGWRKDKNDNLIDEPLKFNDDLLDATRYAIFTHFSNRRDMYIIY